MISLRKIPAAVLLGIGLFAQACDDGPSGPRTGSLTVNIVNLPEEVPAAVTVQGEAGTAPITVTASRTISDLEPGTYTVTAAKAVGTTASYASGAAPQVVEVAAGETPVVVTVGYALATGIAKVTLTGLPAGANAAARITSISGYSNTLTESRTVGNLDPGEYTLDLASIAADELYVGEPTALNFTVTASPVPVEVAATYLAITGSIQLESSGLPDGATPVWDITGPNQYSSTVRGAGTHTVSRLNPGEYIVTARNFDFGSETYGAATRTMSVTVKVGTKALASWAYAARPPSLNVTVEGAYVTQGSQRLNGSVPLIAGRDAFLRVFLKANEPNLAQPKVRVRIYRSGALVSTTTIDAPRESIATILSEREKSDSWGLVIPAGEMTGGLSFMVDADPGNAVRESNESDNTFPASGTPAVLNVRAVPPLEVRFVPIETAINSLVGSVTEGRITELLSRTLGMFPISAYSADVRSTFTTSAPLLDRNDNNGAWGRIINEINTLRVSEGTQRHYVGVLKLPYPSGIVGLGYLPGKTSLSWDAAGAPNTIAHELGHNWGREHAPCGGPAGVDSRYPYADARIGAYGFDLLASTVMDAGLRDLMSYCSPSWVSDYTYEGILNARGSSSATASVSLSIQPSLVVWGRMDGTNLVLEPAFMADTRPSLPAKPGRYRVEGVDASGTPVFSISFDPDRIGDASPRDERQFSFAVPVSQSDAARIVSIRLAGDGKEVRATSASQGTPANVTASAVSGERVRLAWNHDRFPMLVVRDPDTKEILTFARGGEASVRTKKKRLDITASNKVGSTRMVVPAQD